MKKNTAMKKNQRGKLNLDRTTILTLTSKDLILVDGGARPETALIKGCQF
jgi:hypothetical protein